MGLLETLQQKSSEPALVEKQARDKIREIVRAYRHSWDIYSECLQNSVDAINRRHRILNDPDSPLYAQYHEAYPDLDTTTSYGGKIHITVDVPQRVVQIRDNGVGIEAGKIEEFLLPEGTSKRMGQDYGFKGYGLTFAAFISEEFYVATRHFVAAEVHEFALNGLFDWLADDTNAQPFPAEPIPDVQPRAIDSEMDGWNTLVRFRLADDYSVRFPAVSSAEHTVGLAERGRRLDESTQVEMPRGLEFLLRTRTAIGNTRVLFSKAPTVPIDVKLDVIYSDGVACRDLVIPYQYAHPKDHSEVSIVSFDFEDYYDQFKRPSFNRDFRALYHAVEGEIVGSRNPITCDFALCAISQTRLSNIEADLGLDDVESGDVGLSYGTHLAINGMPTGLRIDDWDSKGGTIKRYYVVVDAEMSLSNQLDPGRKGISQYYARMISDRAIELLQSSRVQDSDPFGGYASKHLNHGRGYDEGGLQPQEFRQQVQQKQTQGTQQQSDTREQALIQALHKVSSLKFLPTDEQEVVALFYEMQAKGIIKGYTTQYLAGSHAVYDAALEYEIECSPQNCYPRDSLGIGGVLAQQLKAQGLTRYVHKDHNPHGQLCVDFKKSIGGFLTEVVIRPGRSNKNPEEIDLLIVWDTNVPSSIPATTYTLDSAVDNRRKFHSTTHRLGWSLNPWKEIPCISLKHVVQVAAQNQLKQFPADFIGSNRSYVHHN